ncbi:heterokaryon incompatibility Het-C [Macrolepiota fuliginosa MF-IS2]|uniref:Heterokaryon incompatibility Het-C n=1 Tax=Macrolepiota fuliginosa MF-IS2 TaxID=1400762 RepID=A0A9P5X1Z9_9AGAR|nr:heterokaryon incompatibility Het-C [Macrolepiota fuliginosa MF-IS2]
MPTTLTTLLLVCTVLTLLPTGTYAFGAGDIPDFAYLQEKAFRHGDIESVLENLVKHAGGAAIGGDSLLGFATSVLKATTGGSNFNKMDVKRVYFGNWLRDYSQAMDIAGLSKLSADTITLIVAVLGFMTFGFATQEFEVTQERLGVYLPVEHIDNPKGYAEKEGDARQIHPNLRPPVDPRELELDERTGMKRYMASEGEGWDTSTACIRRTLVACIEYGRRAEGQENADLFEAFRLLGTGLHTLEDLLAHSNWCEIALRKMGHEEVFCHVGDSVIIDTPNGPAPPLVTGTFGGADFLHSLLGEAGDKLSQASVTDLAGKMDQASQGGDTNVDAFKAVLGKLPIGGGEDEVNKTDKMHQQSQAYHFDPDNIAPPEVQRQLLDILTWRDTIVRDIAEKIEMVPGLTELIDELTNALNAYVYTILAPYVVPMITQATGVLDEGSKAVIDNEDQYQVFDDPDASDPSHSLLSKDHFGLILNEPAGKIAQIVVQHSVNLIVQAWSDNIDPDSVLNTILEAFHHPYYATGDSQIQNQMFEHMQMWLDGLGPGEAGQVIERLTKESVREHRNKRIGSEEMNFEEPGYGGCSHGYQQKSTQYSSGGQAYLGGGEESSGRGYSETTYDRGDSTQNEGGGDYSQSYDSRTERDDEQGQYRRDDNNDSYRAGYNPESEYGRSEEYSASSYDRPEENEYGRREDYGTGEGYSSRPEEYEGNRGDGEGGDGGNSGYDPSYTGDETYGAERLNIREDDTEYS